MIRNYPQYFDIKIKSYIEWIVGRIKSIIIYGTYQNVSYGKYHYYIRTNRSQEGCVLTNILNRVKQSAYILWSVLWDEPFNPIADHWLTSWN